MSETRKLAAILVADVVGYSPARGRRRGPHPRAPENSPQRPHRPRHFCASRPHRQAHRRRLDHRVPQRGRRRPVRDRSAARHGRAQRRPWPRTGGSNSGSGFISATSSRRPTATSWATASISPRGSRGLRRLAGICLSEDAYRQVRDRLNDEFIDLGEKAAQEHCPIRSGFMRSRSIRNAPCRPQPGPTRRGRAAAPFNRGSSLRQSRRRFRAGLFRRRRHREPDHRPVAHERLAGDRAQYRFQL